MIKILIKALLINLTIMVTSSLKTCTHQSTPTINAKTNIRIMKQRWVLLGIEPVPFTEQRTWLLPWCVDTNLLLAVLWFRCYIQAQHSKFSFLSMLLIPAWCPNEVDWRSRGSRFDSWFLLPLQSQAQWVVKYHLKQILLWLMLVSQTSYWKTYRGQ